MGVANPLQQVSIGDTVEDSEGIKEKTSTKRIEYNIMIELSAKYREGQAILELLL